MIGCHELDAMRELARREKIARQLLRAFEVAWFKKSAAPADALEKLPSPLRAAFSGAVDLEPLTLSERRDSAIDGASKLVFRTRDGLAIETVILRIATGRTTLCLSTQAGCAAACAFCATGKMGLLRNLSAAEIIGQVLGAGRILQSENRRARNLVFMGMGEPLHNEAALHEALRALIDPARCNFSAQRIIVSTVGVPDGMLRLTKAFPEVSIALSLHSAREDVRQKIMPMARRHSLDELRTALEKISELQGADRRVMIEYLLLAGLTDTTTDADALENYLSGLRVHLNLIPFNPIAGAPELLGSAARQRKAFAETMKKRGFKVTLRYSLGADIAGACGQLVQAGKKDRRAGAAV